jgi:hypothetical protein
MPCHATPPLVMIQFHHSVVVGPRYEDPSSEPVPWMPGVVDRAVEARCNCAPSVDLVNVARSDVMPPCSMSILLVGTNVFPEVQ